MRAKRRGFTLVELLIVVTIIGILLAFILKAYTGSIVAAERSATIALIASLETALTDRVDALTGQRADPNWCHQALARVYPAVGPPIDGNQRAQTIAQFDYLRAELPDVFVVELADPNYKINFGAIQFSPWPPAAGLTGGPADYTLPLGGGYPNPANSLDVPPVTGMKGASFTAAAAIYKQLGFSSIGTNGADDDQDGLIDEWDEGIKGLHPDEVALMLQRLANHKHKTARAAMLYAILVEGTGPQGSSFSREDFDARFIKDTDGDGLLEFVDAWGEPLQFYRWPIMAHSDTQKGFPDLAKISQDLNNSVLPGPYSTVYESREQNPLDPNQQLLAPAWWGQYNIRYPWTTGPAFFASTFHTLYDPLAALRGIPSNTTYWDRSIAVGSGYFAGICRRRAYYSRFLVVSGGPDKRPGTAQLGVDYQALDERSVFPVPPNGTSSTRDASGGPVPVSVANVIQIENQGGRIDPNRDNFGCPTPILGYRNDTNTLLEEFSQDDITTQNLHSPGGPLPASGR